MRDRRCDFTRAVDTFVKFFRFGGAEDFTGDSEASSRSSASDAASLLGDQCGLAVADRFFAATGIDRGRVNNNVVSGPSEHVPWTYNHGRARGDNPNEMSDPKHRDVCVVNVAR